MIGHYTVHPEFGYLEEIVKGVVTLQEMVDFLEGVVSDPNLSPEYNVLVDLSAAHIALRFDEMSVIAGMLKNDIRASRGHVAFVVSSTLNYGMVRMFEALSDDRITVQIFRERAAAEKWVREAANRTQNHGQ